MKGSAQRTWNRWDWNIAGFPTSIWLLFASKCHLCLFLPTQALASTSAYLTRWWSQTTIYFTSNRSGHLILTSCSEIAGQPPGSHYCTAQAVSFDLKTLFGMFYICEALLIAQYTWFSDTYAFPQDPPVGSMLLDQPSIVKWTNILYPLFILPRESSALRMASIPKLSLFWSHHSQLMYGAQFVDDSYVYVQWRKNLISLLSRLGSKGSMACIRTGAKHS
jgi:hypothetical protein